ncbi:hypothetical protein GNI_123100 [Gregarina niphandrodes]|uniref:Uncharacterized protein n=1 Tax=Gregarina niphandrodes TaxID=110365 RepID=A0A023B2E6_GRENI|nr:hypothetical protein GNI_123100 [Gregarina niphandrodes]EZG52127.1 hypothetical protein GNI_123100 [Gregarina niphandrodes]|eukprot:XP_011131902.1 hypothetical protein GNI_123100 [Gregarina niphandrodes]
MGVDRKGVAEDRLPSSKTVELSVVENAIQILAKRTCGDPKVEDVVKTYKSTAASTGTWFTLFEGLPPAAIIEAHPQPDISGAVDIATVTFRTAQKDVKHGLSAIALSQLGLSTFDSNAVFRVI